MIESNLKNMDVMDILNYDPWRKGNIEDQYEFLNNTGSMLDPSYIPNTSHLYHTTVYNGSGDVIQEVYFLDYTEQYEEIGSYLHDILLIICIGAVIGGTYIAYRIARRFYKLSTKKNAG